MDIFTDHAIDATTDAGEADGHILCNCRRRGFKVNAFNIGEDGDCVDLFVTLYNNQDPPVRVPGSDVDRHEYTTYLGFFRADLLVRIYERYGARLLERNVRSFLQVRGKINRGIRDTILTQPTRFLAYNNGISATAEASSSATDR